MQDLTTGSLSRHLLKTTSFMLVSMVFQTLYVLVDLYWVGRLGTDAVAAVAVGGNLMFVVLAATQMLGVGTTTLVSHAVGRKDRERAVLIFNQSQVLSTRRGPPLLRRDDGVAHRVRAATERRRGDRRAGRRVSPLVHSRDGAAVRPGRDGCGAARHGQLQAGHGGPDGDGHPEHRARAGPDFRLGNGRGRSAWRAPRSPRFIAIVVGTVWLALYFVPADAYLKFRAAQWRPRLGLWKDMLKIGLPAGAEFALMAVYLVIVYAVSRPFGAAAQAGFGIGMRIIQACSCRWSRSASRWRRSPARTSARAAPSACARRSMRRQEWRPRAMIVFAVAVHVGRRRDGAVLLIRPGGRRRRRRIPAHRLVELRRRPGSSS